MDSTETQTPQMARRRPRPRASALQSIIDKTIVRVQQDHYDVHGCGLAPENRKRLAADLRNVLAPYILPEAESEAA